MSIGGILKSIVPGVVRFFGNVLTGAGSSSGAGTSYGYSGTSSFQGSSGASGSSSAGGKEGDKDWFLKAVKQTIMFNIQNNMDKAQEQFKKAYKNGL